MKHSPITAREMTFREGFTIIETLFVLAIAGIMLLLILYAIPTLNRSSKNNQRKQDATTILEAVSHYELNNSGNFPISGSNFLQGYQHQITYYDSTSTPVQYYISLTSPRPPSGVAVYAGGPSDTVVPESPSTQLDGIYIYNYQKCIPDGSGSSTNLAAGYGDIVALFALDSGTTTPLSQCKQL